MTETNKEVLQGNIETKETETKVNENKEQVRDTEKEIKTFTQEEVEKIVTSRLAREKKKAEEKQEAAAKLTKMNAEDKAKYEIEKKEKK